MSGHAYLAYGLRIWSELEFPEFLAAPHSAPEADVVVRRAPIEPENPPEPAATSWVVTRGGSQETLCTYEGLGRFVVRGTGLILVDADPQADPAFVRHAILGPVIAPLLWRRGLFTLHASVIGVGERCVAFVAASGEGKSTAGAALYARGNSLVSDDLGAIDWHEEVMRVRPGFPRLRVFPDSLRGVGDTPEAYPLVHSLIDKRSKFAERFARQALPLDRIFVLQSGPSLEAQPLSKREAMLELMHHSYASNQQAPFVGFAEHMRMTSRIADKVPVFRLTRPRDLARLSELVEFVERQLAD